MQIRAHGFGVSFSLCFFCLLSWYAVAYPSLRKYKRPSFCDASKDEDKLSFLWSTKQDPPSYFFGTIHVPYTRVWDHIPENAKQAFANADNVVFELDLMDPATIAALATCQMLPPGRSLVDVLPREMYRRLKQHLEYVKVMMSSWMTADQRGQGLYADYLFNAITGNWERKRPIWVMLMVNSLTESDIKSRGIPVLDLYLAQEAERLSKRTGAVEKVDEQCLPLNGLNFTQVLFALNQTLQQHESIRTGDVQMRYTTDDLIRHYNCGDLDAVVFSRDTAQVPRLANASLTARDRQLARDIDEYFRHELIYKRNRRMGDRVVKLLRAHPGESFFFAFGAGHFLGNNTVLDFVRQGGFEIEHIVATRKIRNLHIPVDHFSSITWHDASLDPRNRLADSRRQPDGVPTVRVDIHDEDDDDDEDDIVDLSGRRGSQNMAGIWRKRNRKRTQSNRAPTVFLARTTPTPSTSKPRKFNDLWVRLDGYTTWRPQLHHLPQHPTGNKDVLAIQQSLKVWYGYNSSNGGSCIQRPLLGLLLFLWWTVSYSSQLTLDHLPP